MFRFLRFFTRTDKFLEDVQFNFRLHNGKLDKGRKRLYHKLRWKLQEIDLGEVGVWDNAQGIPHEWCVGNVLETAEHYKEAKREHPLETLPPDDTLDTIIVVDGRTGRGREKCKPLKWNIDDGCMRAIAKALQGKTRITAYVGTL